MRNQKSVRPKGFLYDALICWVYAPDHIRQERFCRRSHDLLEKGTNEEVRLRLDDSADDIDAKVHLVIKNFEEFESIAIRDTIHILRHLGRYQKI